jgi:hypothetical protein
LTKTTFYDITQFGNYSLWEGVMKHQFFQYLDPVEVAAIESAGICLLCGLLLSIVAVPFEEFFLAHLGWDISDGIVFLMNTYVFLLRK